MWPNANNIIELSCLAGSFSLPPTTDILGDVGCVLALIYIHVYIFAQTDARLNLLPLAWMRKAILV